MRGAQTSLALMVVVFVGGLFSRSNDRLFSCAVRERRVDVEQTHKTAYAVLETSCDVFRYPQRPLHNADLAQTIDF